jgi:hypothetical protein
MHVGAIRTQQTGCQLPLTAQTMELAALAMRGHRSAHSFATGPVMAEPGGAQRRARRQLNVKGA